MFLCAGLAGFCMCNVRECPFFLRTPAQDHTRDLAEFKGVEPALCPTGTLSGGAGGELNCVKSSQVKSSTNTPVMQGACQTRAKRRCDVCSLAIVPVGPCVCRFCGLRSCFWFGIETMQILRHELNQTKLVLSQQLAGTRQ